MDCNSCEKTTAAPAVEVEASVLRAAQKLACLMADTAEFQDFLRLARAVRLDHEVSSLVSQINEYPGYDATGDGLSSVDDLQEQLEALPIVRDYRGAEALAKALFSAVDAAISSTAGLAFAENAKPAACG